MHIIDLSATLGVQIIIVLSSCPKSCMSSHIHICIFKVANKLQVTSLNREYQAQLIPDQILEVVNIQLQISEDKK